MKKIKKYLRILLLWLIKHLNMPKTFNEITSNDLHNIFNSVSNITQLFEHPRSQMNYDSLNPEYKVIEYWIDQGQPNVKSNPPNYSINIDESLNIILVGFNNDDKLFVEALVKGYLRAHGF